MFEKAKAAGLTPQHIADFVNVTRVTASGWFNGHQKPHTILADRIEAFNTALDAALARGALPLPAHVSKCTRVNRKHVYEALRGKSD